MKKEDPYYNKNMLDRYFKEIQDGMSEQNDTLERIEQQTTTTNGRVTKLEFWQKAVIWGLGAVWTLIILGLSIAVPIIRDDLKERDVKSKADINTAIQSFLYKNGYDKMIIEN